MINNFKYIGNAILSKNEYYNNESKNLKKRELLLFHQSLIPRLAKNKNKDILFDGKTICLNFDLKNETYEFKLSDFDMSEQNRSRIFAFKLNAPKDKKKFLMTNNITTFYSSAIKESLEYLAEKRKNKKSSDWFKNNIHKEYDELMQCVLDTFYINTKKDVFVLNVAKLRAEQINAYNLVKDKLINDSKNRSEWSEFFEQDFLNFDVKKISKLNTELWNRMINKIFYNNKDSAKLENTPSIFLITFNNETIIEFDNNKYRNSFVNLCYYDLLGKFFIEKSKEKKICYSCGKTDIKVIDEIPLSMKFYGTTNNLYFENLSSKNAYKSFALCKNCLLEILSGMKYVENTLKDWLFGINVYLIPKLTEEETFIPKAYKPIIKILNKRKDQYKNDVDKLKDGLKKSNKKSLSFDFMFYNAPAGSQEFNILKVISNIDAMVLIQRLNEFDEITEKYGLNLLSGEYGDCSLTIGDLRYYLFPSAITDNNPDFKIYGKDLLNFLESIFSGNQLNYYELISKFVKIFKKRLHKNNSDRFSAFKMNLALNIFNKLNILKGGKMKNGNCATEILNEDYKKFFEAHNEIYEVNCYRQGLFLLGTIISKIIYAQKEKSSNFLKKMNFDGLSARRVPSFVNQVKDFANIYKKEIYEEKDIWGNIMDRLQGIESSSLKADDVVFYILTGISFADY